MRKTPSIRTEFPTLTCAHPPGDNKKSAQPPAALHYIGRPGGVSNDQRRDPPHETEGDHRGNTIGERGGRNDSGSWPDDPPDRPYRRHRERSRGSASMARGGVWPAAPENGRVVRRTRDRSPSWPGAGRWCRSKNRSAPSVSKW